MVSDCGQASEVKAQSTGISQVCPLSTFLFGIVMTILMHNAVAELSREERLTYNEGCLTSNSRTAGEQVFRDQLSMLPCTDQ